MLGALTCGWIPARAVAGDFTLWVLNSVLLLLTFVVVENNNEGGLVVRLIRLLCSLWLHYQTTFVLGVHLIYRCIRTIRRNEWSIVIDLPAAIAMAFSLDGIRLTKVRHCVL